MKILVATDAWHPQVNGVVRTLGHVAREARALGAELEFLTPAEFWTLPMPSYPEIRLALPGPGDVERRLERVRPDAIHIATEGPLGHAMRRVCMRRGLPFTTSFHTRFPDYLAERLPVPERWTCDVTWAWLRRFHSAGAAVLAATPTLGAELASRGFKNVKLWPRGVDATLFRPRQDWSGGRSICRGRFSSPSGGWRWRKISRPFSSSICPAPSSWSATGRRAHNWPKPIPTRCSSGAAHGEALAEIYAAADVFVFPSRTDTFGLVLLEALASGVPVAAFPAAAPRDVIGEAPVGVLDEDLRRACLEALECSREDCRDFALGMTWAGERAHFPRARGGSRQGQAQIGGVRQSLSFPARACAGAGCNGESSTPQR